MHNSTLGEQVEAVLKGPYVAEPLIVGGKAVGNAYASGGDKLLMTYAGESLCDQYPLLVPVLVCKVYLNGDEQKREHTAIGRVKAGAGEVAVKDMTNHMTPSYFENTLLADEMIKEWKNETDVPVTARIPPAYFSKGPIFTMEYVDGIPMDKLPESERPRAMNMLADSGLLGFLLDHGFSTGGCVDGNLYSNDNLLLVRRNGGYDVNLLDQQAAKIV
ncbi:MAG: hypothetical protein NT016_01235 [Candidatus Aenigmarchaeota archaeon]|nr:hypothetical protein [Candidatus Aenigmarchaeota archaeon]